MANAPAAHECRVDYSQAQRTQSRCSLERHPLSFTVNRLALQGQFEAPWEELGGQLSELVSSDPVVESLSVILGGISTPMLTARHLYAYEPFPNATHEVGIWSPRSGVKLSAERSGLYELGLMAAPTCCWSSTTSSSEGHEYVEGYVSAVRDESTLSASSGSIPVRSRSSSRWAVSGVRGVHVAGEGPAGVPGQGSARIGAAEQAVVTEALIAVR